MQAFLIGALLLAGSPAGAQPAKAQPVTYEAVTARSPAGISRLRLTPVGENAYAVDFRIVAPNPTQHKGHVQGLATREGDRFTLRAVNFIEGGVVDERALCTLVIDADDARARVVSAHHCTGFHGAAASFTEQGQDLARVP